MVAGGKRKVWDYLRKNYTIENLYYAPKGITVTKYVHHSSSSSGVEYVAD